MRARLGAQLLGLGLRLADEAHRLRARVPAGLLGVALGRGGLLGDALPQRLGVRLRLRLAP